MNISEDTLMFWSKGPAQTEADKCTNAENAVRKAIQASDELSELDITVFPQGSYRARTNVRQDSDVDICVRYNSTFFADYPEGQSREDYGNVSGTMQFVDFKNLVGEALTDYFGEDHVTRGNKAFDVHANTYRIDADVVATFEHRRYTGASNRDGTRSYLSGVAFKPDKGELIKNWPDQNFLNGINKNTACNRHYKRVVRILKRLCYTMQDDEIAEAKNIGSFLMECLVWNAPNESFSHDNYTADLRAVLAHAFNKTINYEDCKEWGEVNELKYLFRSSQPWTREQAHKFIGAAWDYVGYK